MMKKILVVIAVLAITLISSVALAEVTLSGSIETRGRAFNNTTDQNSDAPDYNRDTQSRLRINFDAKAGDAVAKITVEKDYETWGGACNPGVPPVGGSLLGVECVNGPLSAVREAWILTPLVGPVKLKGGHVLAALGNSWFFRSMKYGTDAWILFADFGPVHVGFVNGKIAEAARDRDLNMNVGVASLKLSDTMTIGADVSQVNFARRTGVAGADVLYNLGVNANLGLGPVKLKAELDLQKGRNNTAALGTEFKGNQLVVEGALVVGPANVNFTVARGSGNDLKGGNLDTKAFVPIQDADPHYTFLYEYKVKTAGANYNGSQTSSGFANTTAVGAGADVKLGSLTVGGNVWWLMATEDVALNDARDLNDNPEYATDLGIEIDARVNWKISDAVSLNTTLGYFMPGDAYSIGTGTPGVNLDPDAVTGIQSVLTMKF